MRRNNKLKLAGNTVKLVPMNARKGLETVILLASVIDESAPYILLLADNSAEVRHLAMAKLLRTPDLATIIIEAVANGTGLSVEEIENATYPEVLEALIKIMKVNDWDKIWSVAQGLQVVKRESAINWLLIFSPFRKS